MLALRRSTERFLPLAATKKWARAGLLPFPAWKIRSSERWKHRVDPELPTMWLLASPATGTKTLPFYLAWHPKVISDRQAVIRALGPCSLLKPEPPQNTLQVSHVYLENLLSQLLGFSIKTFKYIV